MKVIRALLALLLAAAATAVVVRVAIPRLECNLAKGRINRDVRRMGRTGDEYARITLARSNVITCRVCIERFPQDHHWYMLLGANQRVLGERDEAIRSFQQALALIERPEIYAQIAELEIERGNVEAGRTALMTASIFQIFYIDYVSEPMRSEIQNAVMARYDKLRASGGK
jgi:tetratricopeptide (TPR) repeat protein